MPVIPHTHANVRRLHANGLKDREIAARCGVTPSCIMKIRHRLGLPSNHRFPWTVELAERIVNRLLNGERRKAIAAELGVTMSCLNDALHRHVGGTDYDTFHNPIHRFSRAWTMIGMGCTDKEIAAELGVSRGHVRYYRANMPADWLESRNPTEANS